MTTISHCLCSFDYSSVHWWQLEDCNLICIKSKLGGLSLKAASQVSLIKNILFYDCLHTHTINISLISSLCAPTDFRWNIKHINHCEFYCLYFSFCFVFAAAAGFRVAYCGIYFEKLLEDLTALKTRWQKKAYQESDVSRDTGGDKRFELWSWSWTSVKAWFRVFLVDSEITSAQSEDGSIW